MLVWIWAWHVHTQVARYKEVLEVGDNGRLFRAVFPDLVQGAAGAGLLQGVEPAASAQLAGDASASFVPACDAPALLR